MFCEVILEMKTTNTKRPFLWKQYG